MPKLRASLTAAAALALAAAGMAAAPPAADLAPTGTLRASFIASNPVQGRVDARTGAVTGPVADLTRELARRLGVPFVITPLPDAGAVLDSVKAHTVDIGFLAIEAARATQVDFTAPYSLAGSAYAVRADSPMRTNADVDRAGATIGAARGTSQQVFVSANVRNARVTVMPEAPPNDVLARMLIDGELDAFAANRTRMEELARTSPRVRVLADSFLVIGQAIVVDKGRTPQLEELNRFLADLRDSGFVKSSLDRAGLAGVEPAPAPR